MKNHQEEYHVEIWKDTEGFVPSVSSVRILFVIDGKCSTEVSGERRELHKSEILLINSREKCLICDSDHLLLAVISVDYYYLCNAVQSVDLLFHLDSRDGLFSQYRKVRDLLQEFLFAWLDKNTKSPFCTRGLFHILLHELIQNYRVQTEELHHKGANPLAVHMINYVHSNYKNEISLNHIAKELFLTPSSASRIFQKATGEKFITYVKRIRLEHVCMQLAQTDKLITVIAMENGFISPSALNRTFREEFGLSPSEFREQKQKEQDYSVETENIEEAWRVLQIDKNRSSEEIRQTCIVSGELTKMEPLKRWVNKILSIGPIRVLASGNMQNHVLYLVDHLRIEYLHAWNVISQQMVTKDADGYNYSPLDEILDFCVDHRIRLMLDLSQRRDVAMASEKKEIYRLKSELVFNSAMEWMDALGSFLFHISKRYGLNIVSEWIFEFTFFQNDEPCYPSDHYSNRTVWEQGVSLVRRFIPNARVAGPGCLGTKDLHHLETQLRGLFKSEMPPDIFTFISFPYYIKNPSESGSSNQDAYERDQDPDFLDGHISRITKWLSDAGFQGECWMTDWGFSIANRNFLQDSCFRGAFFLNSVMKYYDRLDHMGIFYASDLLNVFKDSKAVLAGSGGILTKNGIRKPVYYALDFISKLGRYVIARTDYCVATAETERELQILCWNCQHPDIMYYLTEEDSIEPKRVNALFSEGERKNIDILIKTPLPDGSYQIKQRIVNEQSGSILNKWISFNCSEELSKDDMEYLQTTSVPVIQMNRIHAVNHTIRFTAELESNEMRLVSITKE